MSAAGGFASPQASKGAKQPMTQAPATQWPVGQKVPGPQGMGPAAVVGAVVLRSAAGQLALRSATQPAVLRVQRPCAVATMGTFAPLTTLTS
ncbi:hypothetical protein [Defluviicoccus vanus]|uniref:hypothetical protein n=1 Tax=Defluviicoccus vanus TaxID=111831 RepID=UPI0021D79D95|nr:hypothetical protein [Defluviicoccus vanus]